MNKNFLLKYREVFAKLTSFNVGSERGEVQLSKNRITIPEKVWNQDQENSQKPLFKIFAIHFTAMCLLLLKLKPVITIDYYKLLI